ncbi:MAG: 5-(carboxyamino)imidazole ribonucleotide synthase [Gammaproteobacteria bacterium]
MRVGIIGGGQLGRMLAWAGLPLGMDFSFIDPSPGAPAGELGRLTVAPFEDRTAMFDFAQNVDVVTYEFENVSAPLLREVGAARPVMPSPEALEASQDRLSEKTLFHALGIPTTRYVALDRKEELPGALEKTGLPAILKTRRLGYDGRGQVPIYEYSDAVTAFRTLASAPGGLIIEGRVVFEREISIVACRDRAGSVVFYPPGENVHQDGILRSSYTPFRDASLVHHAEDYARRILEHFDYIGVLAVEFFVENGALIANEMAPRVHNSGHWSIEACITSQFENHLRALIGLPLGSTELRREALMVNAVGHLPEAPAILALPDVHLHDYHKAPRPGRKVGHVTALAETREALEKLAPRLFEIVPFERHG